MANTYITSGSRFKPFTFDEMIKPATLYKEAYDKADAELNTLLENSALNFSFMPQDTAEKAVYDDMMSRLQGLAGQLSQGLNPQVAKDIRDINKEYRTKMLPIQQKIAKRAELADKQTTQQASNPNIRFTKDYSKASLSDITSNSSYGIIDLDKVYKQAGTDFAEITSNIYNDELEPVAIGDTGYFKVKSGYGYTPTQFIDEMTDVNSEVRKFYDERIEAIESRTDIDDDIKAEMIDAVYRGMAATAGTFTEKIVKGVSPTSSSSTSGDKSQGIAWEPRPAFNDNEYDYWKMKGSTVIYAVKKGSNPNNDESVVVDTKTNIDKKRNADSGNPNGGSGSKVSLEDDSYEVQIYTKFGNNDKGKPYRRISQIDPSKHFNNTSEFKFTSGWDSKNPSLKVHKFEFSDVSRSSPFRQYLIDKFVKNNVTENTIDYYYELGIDHNGILRWKQRKQVSKGSQNNSNPQPVADSTSVNTPPIIPQPIADEEDDGSNDNIGL